MKGKTLLIIDAQHDFIDGSMAVEGAKETMDKLTEYVKEHGKEYEGIIFTVDWHPITHCSFQQHGGQWPNHCVAFSEGAALYNPLLMAAHEAHHLVFILTKGTVENKEEYSIFKNEQSFKILMNFLAVNDTQQIDVCGIAYDYCVHDSVEDAMKLGMSNKLHVLKDYCPCIGDRQKIDDWLEDEGIDSE